MQEACSAVALRDGPMLAVIEDETGAGKTEAALILAQRMMAAGKGRGLFFALPTMATADAMFLRNRDCIAGMFDRGPSLTLAHGRAGLSVGFRDLIGRERANPDEPGCSDWLAEDRRRALLADVGVGTIDQALLAVLPTRHSCLRLYGLSSKILIVDEVYEMGDPYLQELLVTLLRIHAAMGGSAILLTATLPLGLRARLVAAFEEGAGRETSPSTDRAYPALTVAGAAAPDLPGAGFGSYGILWQIAQCLANDLPYLYLGYWIERNFNTVEDRSILRHADAVRAGVEAFLADQGATPGGQSLSDLAIDVTAP